MRLGPKEPVKPKRDPRRVPVDATRVVRGGVGQNPVGTLIGASIGTDPMLRHGERVPNDLLQHADDFYDEQRAKGGFLSRFMGPRSGAEPQEPESDEGALDRAGLVPLGRRIPVQRLEDLRGEVDPADMRRSAEDAVRRNGGYSDDSRDSAHDRPMLHRLTETMHTMPKKVMDTRGELSRDPEPDRDYDDKGRLKARSVGEGYQAFKDLIRGKGGR